MNNIGIQPGFFGEEKLAGDIEYRIMTVYRDNPDVADSDRLLIFEVWRLEGLDETLGDKLHDFKNWFLEKASSSDAITRAGRKLRSEGRIKQSPEAEDARRKLTLKYLKK